MIYYIEERKDGYAVIGRGNDRSADIGLTKTQADNRAHELAGKDGYVGWKGINGKFKEWCPCKDCKRNLP
jgi:ribosome modulation factor